jgi:hypothetical protein
MAASKKYFTSRLGKAQTILRRSILKKAPAECELPDQRGFFATGTPKSVLNAGRIMAASLNVIPTSRAKNRPKQG